MIPLRTAGRRLALAWVRAAGAAQELSSTPGANALEQGLAPCRATGPALSGASRGAGVPMQTLVRCHGPHTGGPGGGTRPVLEGAAAGAAGVLSFAAAYAALAAQPSKPEARLDEVSRLGSGCSADVYLAHDERYGRVAMKLIHDGTGPVEEKALLRVGDHPNVVKLRYSSLTIGHPEGRKVRATLCLELGEGGDLAHHIHHGGPFDEPTARRIFQQLVEGLGALHDRGVLHRDIKPHNVVLSEDRRRVFFIDLGHAALKPTAEPVGTWHAPEITLGTVGYVAPEGAATAASDVYSLGRVLAALMQGPYETIQPKLSPELDALLRKMTAQDPAKRPTLAEIRQSAWLNPPETR